MIYVATVVFTIEKNIQSVTSIPFRTLAGALSYCNVPMTQVTEDRWVGELTIQDQHFNLYIAEQEVQE